MNGTTVQAISTAVLSWKFGRLHTPRAAVLDDRIEHHAKHADEDQRADHHDEVVQPELVGGDARHRWVQIDLIHRGTTRQVVHRERGGRCQPHAQPECRLSRLAPKCCHRLHRRHFFENQFNSTGVDRGSAGSVHIWCSVSERGSRTARTPRAGRLPMNEEDVRLRADVFAASANAPTCQFESPHQN